jgi:[phosphatase 2A protein]-leucine-carboxy methyltransferase
VKAQRISRSPALQSPLHHTTTQSTTAKPYTISKGGTQLQSDVYTLLPLDLKSNPATTLTEELLPLLDPLLPTLFLAECVFCYLKPEVGEEIVQWFDRFENCAGVIYEMCGLE